MVASSHHILFIPSIIYLRQLHENNVTHICMNVKVSLLRKIRAKYVECWRSRIRYR